MFAALFQVIRLITGLSATIVSRFFIIFLKNVYLIFFLFVSSPAADPLAQPRSRYSRVFFSLLHLRQISPSPLDEVVCLECWSPSVSFIFFSYFYDSFWFWLINKPNIFAQFPAHELSFSVKLIFISLLLTNKQTKNDLIFIITYINLVHSGRPLKVPEGREVSFIFEGGKTLLITSLIIVSAVSWGVISCRFSWLTCIFNSMLLKIKKNKKRRSNSARRKSVSRCSGWFETNCFNLHLLPERYL